MRFIFLSSINICSSSVYDRDCDQISHWTGTPGVTEHVCVPSAKQSGELVLWDWEEAYSSDKNDALYLPVEYRGMHIDLSSLGENCFFVSYSLLNRQLYMHPDQHLSEHQKAMQPVKPVLCQS